MFQSPQSSQSIGGSGTYQSTRIGYTAGLGTEWMFQRNWSLKAEALYYNLGTASFADSPLGTGLIVNLPVTKVRFDGVIARMGVNYHFNSVSEPVRAKF